MKIVVLAAGEGSRLRPLTNKVPKCMVKIKGKPIIDHQLDCYKQIGVDDIVIVKGYLAEVLQRDNVSFVVNQRYNETNMVYSLFCAEEHLNDDIIIVYGDIVFQPAILEKLIQSPDSFATTVDLDWFRFWSARMEDPLSDAETLKLDSHGYITELGKSPQSLNDIEGQYMGLIKINKEVLGTIKDFYHSLDKDKTYDGKLFENMYMTSFLQLLIDNGILLKAITVNGGWIEVDEPSDIPFYEEFVEVQNLNKSN